jgi:hypothetical protein
VTGRRLERWEVDALRTLDGVYLDEAGKTADAAKG